MIRAARLAVSRPMYAFDPKSWRKANYGNGYEIDAAWFKRKDGVLSAVCGTYHPFVQPFANEPDSGDYNEWIAAANDNRYGGSWAAKWNGKGLLVYSTPVTPEASDYYVQLLDPVLKNFPDPPPGFDGWWTFPKTV